MEKVPKINKLGYDYLLAYIDPYSSFLCNGIYTFSRPWWTSG
jgi:hypothetical protein